MAFVRRKKVRGYTYYQFVRNYREGGKHRQEVLCHLGPYDSLEEAIRAEEQRVVPGVHPCHRTAPLVNFSGNRMYRVTSRRRRRE